MQSIKKPNKKAIFAAIMMSIMLVAFSAGCSNNSAEAQKEYAEWYEEYRLDLESAMIDYAKRMMEIEPGSKKWYKSVKESLDGLQKVVDRVDNKKDVPSVYKKAHEYLLEANKGYQYLIDETPSSIRTLNENSVDGLNDIEKKIDDALDATNKADDEVNKVRKDKKDKE